MQFLADLDYVTVILTWMSAIFVLLTQGLLWGFHRGRWPRSIRGLRVVMEDGFVIGILIFIMSFGSLRAYDSYCPDADQPHLRATGPVNQLKPYRYLEMRHWETGILGCVGPYGKGVPLMRFDERATALVANILPSVPLNVTYLARLERADTSDGQRFQAHPVVEVDDAATGDRIFYLDTTRHWPRVIILLGNIFICLLAFAFCLMRRESELAPYYTSSQSS